MKHEYTDIEMTAAADIAVTQTSSTYSAVGLPYLRALLDALPEPQQDWQKCGFNDFRPTDKRAKAVFIGGSIIEGTPDRRTSEHVFLVDGPVIHSYDDATFYRIPAPVVHPYPLDHPAIVVTEADGYEDTNPQVFVWTGNRYENDAWSFDADDITSWKPVNAAKVVSADE